MHTNPIVPREFLRRQTCFVSCSMDAATRAATESALLCEAYKTIRDPSGSSAGARFKFFLLRTL